MFKDPNFTRFSTKAWTGAGAVAIAPSQGVKSYSEQVALYQKNPDEFLFEGRGSSHNL